MTLIEQARDILKRKDETLYDAHAFLFPMIAELVAECERLKEYEFMYEGLSK